MIRTLATYGVALLLVLNTACRNGGEPHADAERPSLAITHFSSDTELFVEFPALVVGAESPFAAHITRLDSYQPLAAGEVSVVLSGGGAPEERFDVKEPRVAGIFRPVATPVHAATRTLTLLVEGEGVSDRHDLGGVNVSADLAAARASATGDAETGGAAPITFLKEQQWRVPFATVVVTRRSLRASVSAHGAVRARPDGEARISAPVTGRLVTAPSQVPVTGAAVTPETVLAIIAPRLSDATDPAELEREVARARRGLERARVERERLEQLHRAGAIPERRLLTARHDERDAEAELQATEHRLRQHEGIHHASEQEPGGRIAVRSPIAGTIVRVAVAPGEFVEEGRALFDVVDLDSLWLEVRIPEADLGRVRGAVGAWFEIGGFDTRFQIGAEHGGRVVTLGGVVDPESRTTPLIFETPNAEKLLRVGMFADVHVLTGEAISVPAIPISAIVDEGGQSIAYVQLEGEAFERRVVEPGIRDGEWVEVASGVAEGERVVSRGAYYVRLASASSGVPAHGHAH